MMRSLWTAASGMKAQQITVDTIANNLANVNTVGFKKERVEFNSLLYETIRNAGDIDQGGTPINLQVGHGVYTAGSVKTFTQGNLEMTEGSLDFAISGGGFFAVKSADGETQYTKDGAFKMALYDGGLVLSTVKGYPVLGTDGEPITFDNGTNPSNLNVDEKGNLSYVSNGESVDLGKQMQVVQFNNVSGVKSLGSGFFQQTIASGEPLLESENEELEGSQINQGMLESSNVQAVEEMVKMIIAQRAYELSSKAIQTSDDMLGMANSLKR